MNRRSGMTLLEVLVASVIAGVFLFPLARYLYKSTWNQAGTRRMFAESRLDSLVRAVSGSNSACLNPVRLEFKDWTGSYAVGSQIESNGKCRTHGIWRSRTGGPTRELWLERAD